MVNSKFEELLGKTAIEGTQKIMKGVKKKDDEDEEEEEETNCVFYLVIFQSCKWED